MNIKSIQLLLLCTCLLSSCNVFNPEEPESFSTYITTIPGNGYDIAFDLLETADGYILAGATGPQCDIVDAYLATVDKVSGGILSLKTFGESNQGVEENFFALSKVTGGFKAVGFWTLRKPPGEENAVFCETVDDDGKIFLTSFDEGFNALGSEYLGMEDNKFDGGFDIIEDSDQNTLIAGAWQNNIAVVQLTGSTTNVIRSASRKGNGYKLLQHSSGRIFLGGGYKTTVLHTMNDSTTYENIYWAELDLANGLLTNERTFLAPNPAVDSQAVVGSLVETSDGNLLLAGLTFEGLFGPRKIFLLKTDLEGNELWYNILPMGINDSVHDIIVVDGGFVIAGSTKQAGSTMRSDAMIAKIDENGTLLWKEQHDLRSSSDEAWKVIATSDRGYLLGGQTFDRTNGIRSSLLIKTDGEGRVE